uniref:Uncharacterized protein n=1 Tax=Picea glauca TaxID=3330 RepID=A0A124GNE4_PICGL|nr:hypothetical protein ABT39_MTgene4577 [Picea glauca]
MHRIGCVRALPVAVRDQDRSCSMCCSRFEAGDSQCVLPVIDITCPVSE